MKLKISNGRVIDPASGLDQQTDVYIADGRIAAIGTAPAGFETDASSLATINASAMGRS